MAPLLKKTFLDIRWKPKIVYDTYFPGLLLSTAIKMTVNLSLDIWLYNLISCIPILSGVNDTIGGGGGIVHLPKLLCYNKVCGMVGAEKLLCLTFVIDTSSGGVALWIISLLAALLYSASRAAPFVWPKGWKGAGDCNCVWWKGRKGEWRGNQIMK